MKNLKFLFYIALLTSALSESFAFCGFYVAKADAKLFNKASQVILVRNGDATTITMSNDFQGEVKDFAMVVPVPTVLKRNDIRVVNQNIFEALNAYSGPRLVEYFDHNPCAPKYEMYDMAAAPTSMVEETSVKVVQDSNNKDKYQQIEALQKTIQVPKRQDIDFCHFERLHPNTQVQLRHRLS